MRKARQVLLGVLLVSAAPCSAWAGSGILYPTAGYLFPFAGNAGRLEGTPAFGCRLEYHFAREEVRALGLVYGFSRHPLAGEPAGVSLEQHLCMIGYRFGKDWQRLRFGSQVGVGAVVRDAPAGRERGFRTGYAFQTGINMSYCPVPWLEIGPDANFLIATDMRHWIFGGKTSYFFLLGGHVGLSF